MKKLSFISIIIFSVIVAHAQYSVRLIVTNIGAATKNYDNIFLTGNFNEWNPSDNSKKLKSFGAAGLLLF